MQGPPFADMMERRCQLGVAFCPGGMGLISCAAWAPGFLLVGWNDDGRAFPPDSSMNKAARSQTGEEGATDPPPALSPRGRRSLVGATFASLAYRNFTYLWLGQVTHAGALWIDTVARPLLVLELSGGSAVHLGLVMAARTVPAVVFGLFAGVVADSFNRRIVLLVTKNAVFVLGAIFAALVIGGWVELWHVYAFSLMRGFTMAFDQPARRAMIPSLVPPELVTNAMALSGSSIQIMRIAGAGMAGGIIAFSGLEMAFLAIVLFYAAAAVFTWRMAVPDHAGTGYRGVAAIGSDLVEGLRFAWSEAAIRGVLLASMGYFAFGMTFTFIFAPLFAVEVLDIGQSGFGYMMAVIGLGGVAGSILIAALNPRRRGLLMVGVLAALGVLLVCFSLVGYLGSALALFVAVGFVGAATGVFFPVANAILVQGAPENMRGRVLGLMSLDRGMMTVGGAAAGFLVAAIDVQPAQIVFGVGCVLSALITLVVVPEIRRID